MINETIFFLEQGRKKEFNIRHNLHEQGVNIKNEIVPWLKRTRESSKASFRRYLKEKYTDSTVL